MYAVVGRDMKRRFFFRKNAVKCRMKLARLSNYETKYEIVKE